MGTEGIPGEIGNFLLLALVLVPVFFSWPVSHKKLGSR